MLFNKNSLIALGFSSIAQVVSADSQDFGLITIRSGSAYQNTGVGVKNNELFVGSSPYPTFVVTDAGELKLSTGEYAVVGDNDITLGTTGSTGFSIENSYLKYKGSSGFGINDGVLKVGSGSDGLGYALVPFHDTSRASDFIPSGSSSSSNSSSTTTQSTTTFQTQTDNGAANYKASFGAAGALAIGALLL